MQFWFLPLTHFDLLYQTLHEEFDKEDQNELEEETKTAIQKATEFYDVEIAKYENDGGNN